MAHALALVCTTAEAAAERLHPRLDTADTEGVGQWPTAGAASAEHAAANAAVMLSIEEAELRATLIATGHVGRVDPEEPVTGSAVAAQPTQRAANGIHDVEGLLSPGAGSSLLCSPARCRPVAAHGSPVRAALAQASETRTWTTNMRNPAATVLVGQR